MGDYVLHWFLYGGGWASYRVDFLVRVSKYIGGGSMSVYIPVTADVGEPGFLKLATRSSSVATTG